MWALEDCLAFSAESLFFFLSLAAKQMDLHQIRSGGKRFWSYRKKQERKSVEAETLFTGSSSAVCCSHTTLWKDETTTRTCSLIPRFHPPPVRAGAYFVCKKRLIFTLFCSLQWLRSLSSSRRAAEAHCAASLRMRLFMKLSDSFPVPTCSSRVPMSDWKTAWKTGAIKISAKDLKCRELLMWPFHTPMIHSFMYSKPWA